TLERRLATVAGVGRRREGLRLSGPVLPDDPLLPYVEFVPRPPAEDHRAHRVPRRVLRLLLPEGEQEDEGRDDRTSDRDPVPSRSTPAAEAEGRRGGIVA